MKKVVVFIAILIFLNSIASVVFTPPILALMIPIVVILAFSPIGKAISSIITGNPVNTYSLFSFSKDNKSEIEQLKDRCNYLESKFKEYDEEFHKMREAVIFYENKKIPFNKTASTENEEQKGKIDLTKRQDTQN